MGDRGRRREGEVAACVSGAQSPPMIVPGTLPLTISVEVRMRYACSWRNTGVADKRALRGKPLVRDRDYIAHDQYAAHSKHRFRRREHFLQMFGLPVPRGWEPLGDERKNKRHHSHTAYRISCIMHHASSVESGSVRSLTLRGPLGQNPLKPREKMTANVSRQGILYLISVRSPSRSSSCSW